MELIIGLIPIVQISIFSTLLFHSKCKHKQNSCGIFWSYILFSSKNEETDISRNIWTWTLITAFSHTTHSASSQVTYQIFTGFLGNIRVTLTLQEPTLSFYHFQEVLFFHFIGFFQWNLFCCFSERLIINNLIDVEGVVEIPFHPLKK